MSSKRGAHSFAREVESSSRAAWARRIFLKIFPVGLSRQVDLVVPGIA